MDLFRTAAGDAAGRGISLRVDQMSVFNYALYQRDWRFTSCRTFIFLQNVQCRSRRCPPGSR